MRCSASRMLATDNVSSCTCVIRKFIFSLLPRIEASLNPIVKRTVGGGWGVEMYIVCRPISLLYYVHIQQSFYCFYMDLELARAQSEIKVYYYINRLKDDRWTSRVTAWRPYHKKRRQGRPAKRWRDNLDKYWSDTIWRRTAQDRVIWRRHADAFAQPRDTTAA